MAITLIRFQNLVTVPYVIMAIMLRFIGNHVTFHWQSYYVSLAIMLRMIKHVPAKLGSFTHYYEQK